MRIPFQSYGLNRKLLIIAVASLSTVLAHATALLSTAVFSPGSVNPLIIVLQAAIVTITVMLPLGSNLRTKVFGVAALAIASGVLLPELAPIAPLLPGSILRTILTLSSAASSFAGGILMGLSSVRPADR